MENGRQSIWKLSSHKICDVSRWFLIRLCFRFLFLLLRYNEIHFIKDLLEKMPFFLFCEHNHHPPPSPPYSHASNWIHTLPHQGLI